MKLKPMEPIRSQVATWFAQHPSATSPGSDLKALLDKGVAVEWLDTFKHPMGQTFAAVKYGDEVIFVREADAKAQFGALQAAREHTMGGIFGTESTSSQQQSRVLTALSDRGQGPWVYENDLVKVAGAELRRSGKLEDGFFEAVETAQKLDVRHFMVKDLAAALGNLRRDYTTLPKGWDDQAQRTFATLSDNTHQPYVSGTDVRALAAKELAATGRLGPGFFVGAERAKQFNLRGWIDSSGDLLAKLQREYTGDAPAHWDPQAERVFTRFTQNKREDPYVTPHDVRNYAAQELIDTGRLGPGFYAAAGLAEKLGERMFIEGAGRMVAQLKERFDAAPAQWSPQASRVFRQLVDRGAGPFVSDDLLRRIAASEIADHGALEPGFFAAVKLAQELRVRTFESDVDVEKLKRDLSA